MRSNSTSKRIARERCAQYALRCTLAGKVHGRFREGSGKVQGRFREGVLSMRSGAPWQGRFREGSGKVQGRFRVVQGRYAQYALRCTLAGKVQGRFREGSGKVCSVCAQMHPGSGSRSTGPNSQRGVRVSANVGTDATLRRGDVPVEMRRVPAVIRACL
jgi:hypothetical protein